MGLVSDDAVSSYLDEKIQSALDIDESELRRFFVKDKEIVINGKIYNMSCWVEDIVEGKLFSIEISKKKFFFLTEVHARGILITDAGRRLIDQGGMWDLGLG